MSNKPIEVILVGYKARTGKDTVANLLTERANFVRAAFADKLKEMVGDLYRFKFDQMHGHLKDVPDERYSNLREIRDNFFAPQGYLTPRRVLQIFGQDQRSIFEGIWADYLCFVTFERHIRAGVKKIVVPDFRFPNELEVVKKWSEWRGNVAVRTIKIVRENADKISGAKDISELALDQFEDWDAVIDNHGTIEELWSKIQLIL